LEDSLAKYRLLTNHDSLSTLDEKSYNSLDDKPTIPSVTPAALTKVDDTNVTLTLGGTPATSLLQATSLTLGWTGILGSARGGTGNGFTKFSGPATAERTFTLPNENATLARTDAGQTFTGNNSFTGDLLPSADIAYDLGSSSYRWDDVYGFTGDFSFAHADYLILPRSTEPSAVVGQGWLYTLSTDDDLYFKKSNGTLLNISDIVPFPGFGTNHSTAAYGDHLHTGTYAPLGAISYHTEAISIVNNTFGNHVLYIVPHPSQASDIFTIRNKGNTANLFTVDPLGVTTLAKDLSVEDEAYGSGWDGSVEVPTKNAVYDALQIQYVKVSLDNATIKALYETPYTLIAAPGAGKALKIDPQLSAIRINYVSSTLTDASLYFYINGVSSYSTNAQGSIINGIINTSTTKLSEMTDLFNGFSLIENQALLIKPGEDITTG
jgi:hypothetical protein